MTKIFKQNGVEYYKGKEKYYTRRIIDSIYLGDLEGSLNKAIDFLKSKVNGNGNELELQISDASYGEGVNSLDIFEVLPATPEEINIIDQKQKEFEKLNENARMKLYEQLKKEFGEKHA